MFVKTKYEDCIYVTPNKPYYLHTSDVLRQNYIRSEKGYNVTVVLDGPSLHLDGLGYFEPVITGLPKENKHEQ